MKRNILFSGIIFFSLVYWFSEGATEGYTWADSIRRDINIIISGTLGDGAGILGYHGYRFLEVLGILSIALLSWILKPKPFRNSGFNYYCIFFGSQFTGAFIYERVLMYVSRGILFKDPGWIFKMFGLEIPRYPWQDWIILTIGVLFIVWGLLRK